MRKLALPLIFLAALLRPGPAQGCACGCGVFDVQTEAILPTGTGGTAFLEYDLMNQDRNWSGSAGASADDNGDKQVRTHLMTAGAQYMLNRRWGFSAEIPAWSRAFKTTDDDGNSAAAEHTALGDIRLRGLYSGFSPDMSAGLSFGVKLPTGDYQDPRFDRDTQIGSGSADLLLGAYRRGSLSADRLWTWFSSVSWDEPALTAAGYRPGAEVDALAGAYYGGWDLSGVKIVPMAQVIAIARMKDGGALAHPEDSGYRRLVAGPGFELDADRWLVNGSVGFPVAQSVNGNQLVASHFFKLRVGYRL